MKSLQDEVKSLKHDNQLHTQKHGHLQQKLDTVLMCSRGAEVRADDAHAALQRAVDMAAVSADEADSMVPARHGMSPHSIKMDSDGGIRSGDLRGGFISVHSKSFAAFTSHVMRLAQSDVEQLAGSITNRSSGGGVGKSSGNGGGGGGGNTEDIGFDIGSYSFMSDNDCMVFDLLREVCFLYMACSARVSVFFVFLLQVHSFPCRYVRTSCRLYLKYFHLCGNANDTYMCCGALFLMIYDLFCWQHHLSALFSVLHLTTFPSAAYAVLVFVVVGQIRCNSCSSS